MAANVFINEIHYDNAGTDTGEFVEIAGAAGTDLTGWKIILYNGANGQSYNTVTLSGALANQQNGFGTRAVTYPVDGIQNGSPDAIALVDPSGAVVQFLSYEGVFTATNGPAAGLTSVDIGVSEGSTAPVGGSLGLVGSGTSYADFHWAAIGDDTVGGVNVGQTFGGVVPQPGTLSIADATVAEGNAGTSDIVFTVTRADGSAGAVSATWTVSFGSATASDFGASFTATGTVSFAAGATTAEVRLPVQGDTSFESDESFTVTLSAPTGGATLGDAVATGTITNDDAAPPAPVANVFINEIHYDNAGTDVGEAIEIAGAAGTNLSGYKLVLYNGTNTPDAAPSYTTTNLSGVIDDEGNGFGAVSFAYPVNGLQNGAADGVALIAPDGTVIQLLSYEGTFTAAAGTPAAGVTSTDIGVSEEPAPGVGLSLQLKGTGSSAADFTWTAASDDSFGTLNDGQTFLPANGPSHIRIGDARVVEGDSGTANLVFTVNRAGGTANAASVSYSVDLDGTATADDLAPGAVLSGTVSFAAGETSKQIVVAVKGDTVGEPNETLSVHLGAATGDVIIDDGAATGTITNDDPISLTISQIQGEGHVSAYVGQTVATTGIVTAVDTNGFYLQSAVGDGNARTSDAVFVFTSTAPTVAVGDGVSVRGSVAEFQGSTASLSVTEITAPTVTVDSHGNALPTAVLIGQGGMLPPAEAIDNDGLTSYDPGTDGIDFWESLEGMRVTIDTPQAVSNTNEFGETDVVASHGAGATGVNDRGGITISPGSEGVADYNPEKIQIDDDSGIFAGFTPGYTIGDQLSSVTGVVNYAFDNYEVVVTEAVTTTNDVTLARETTALHGDANNLSIATYNLENLDTSDNKFDILAHDIVYNLGAPDIIAAQEIQDADGAGSGSNLSGTVTAQGLIDAIYAASGKHYAYVEIAPTTPGSTGGEPGGNIRNGYFYNVDRVSYVAGSAQLIEGAAYNGTRKPLVAQFAFAGQTITTINVHLTSRLGSEPLWGDHQPATDAGDAARTAQAAGVKAWVQDHLADNPALNIAVLGDWNGFYFEQAQTQLTDPAQGGVFTNLNSLLPEEERYSYMFGGNAQQIDNILVTGGLVTNAQYDSVHLNAEFGGSRPTDHDPQVALLRLGAAPHDVALSNAGVAENLPAGTVVGTVSASDTPGDTLAYSLVDNAGGLFAIDAATGVITTTAPLNHEAVASYNLVVKVTDSGGLSAQQGFAIAVTDVNEAPVAAHDAVAVNEDATTANLWSTLLGNDSDPDAGQAPVIQSVDTSGTLGSVIFDAATQTLKYVADNDAFDMLAPGATQIDHFTYTITDANGLTSSATVDVTVTGIADGVTRTGTYGADVINGTAGEDRLWGGGLGNDTINGLGGHDLISGGLANDKLDGGDGNDVLFGNMGDDSLWGGNGKDVLVGGYGNDKLWGGAGADSFHFGATFGDDTIYDFNAAEDRIVLDDGVKVTRTRVQDVNGDGAKDLVLTLSTGSVTLLGVSDASLVKYGAQDYYSTHQPGIDGNPDSVGGFGSTGAVSSGPSGGFSEALFGARLLLDLAHGF
ncbi:lamin tail domain-containing protein [Sphingomonas psychrotolerans]|uniref:Lamin tail domain-containing protein n=1 Tax=Sphingomonas psychrotolerans TaxID=1327635 RepID=A0ABU3N259_9SPHN|nr:cadherin domain-containing protein [Sphingomonas psychrotolerans]MDT8758635.1 lamin tail domain-containing protein [Sphingomonas psychrotolerans]